MVQVYWFLFNPKGLLIPEGFGNQCKDVNDLKYVQVNDKAHKNFQQYKKKFMNEDELKLRDWDNPDDQIRSMDDI